MSSPSEALDEFIVLKALFSPIVQALNPYVQKGMSQPFVEGTGVMIPFYRFQCGSTFSA